jgi:isopentenyldiphosphate isomerase
MNKISIVDDSDNVIEEKHISDAYNNGDIVRISRIIIINSRGDILLQLRSPENKSSAGLWDQSAAGHVDAGETYEQAAYRELEEEMGISGVNLNFVEKYYGEEPEDNRVKRRFNCIYAGQYDGAVKIDNDEVSDYRWISKKDLLDEIQESPDSLTIGAVVALNKALNYLKLGIPE